MKYLGKGLAAKRREEQPYVASNVDSNQCHMGRLLAIEPTLFPMPVSSLFCSDSQRVFSGHSVFQFVLIFVRNFNSNVIQRTVRRFVKTSHSEVFHFQTKNQTKRLGEASLLNVIQSPMLKPLNMISSSIVF